MAEVAFAPNSSLNDSFRRSDDMSTSWEGSLRGFRESGEALSRRRRNMSRNLQQWDLHHQYAATSVHAGVQRKPPVPCNSVDDSNVDKPRQKYQLVKNAKKDKRLLEIDGRSMRRRADEAEALRSAAVEAERLTARVPVVAEHMKIMYDKTNILVDRLEERMEGLVAGYTALNKMAVSAPLDIAQFAGELSGVARDIASADLGLTYSTERMPDKYERHASQGDDVVQLARVEGDRGVSETMRKKNKNSYSEVWDPERVHHDIFALHEEHVELARNTDLRGRGVMFGTLHGGGTKSRTGCGVGHATTSDVGIPGGIPLAGSALYNAGQTIRNRRPFCAGSVTPSYTLAASRSGHVIPAHAGPIPIAHFRQRDHNLMDDVESGDENRSTNNERSLSPARVHYLVHDETTYRRRARHRASTAFQSYSPPSRKPLLPTRRTNRHTAKSRAAAAAISEQGQSRRHVVTVRGSWMQPTATQARRRQLKETDEIRMHEEGIVAARRRKSNAKFRARKKAELKKFQEDLKQNHDLDKQRDQQHQDEEKDISNEKQMNLEDVENYSAIRSVSYSQPSKDHSMIPNSLLPPNSMPRPRIDGSSLSEEQSQSGDENHDTEHENEYISAVSDYTRPSGPPERTIYRIMAVGNSRTHCDTSSGQTANLPRSPLSQRTGSLPQPSPTPGATARNRADHEDIDARSAFDGTGESRDEGEIDENDCRSAAEWAEAARKVEERCSMRMYSSSAAVNVESERPRSEASSSGVHYFPAPFQTRANELHKPGDIILYSPDCVLPRSELDKDLRLADAAESCPNIADTSDSNSPIEGESLALNAGSDQLLQFTATSDVTALQVNGGIYGVEESRSTALFGGDDFAAYEFPGDISLKLKEGPWARLQREHQHRNKKLNLTDIGEFLMDEKGIEKLNSIEKMTADGPSLTNKSHDVHFSIKEADESVRSLAVQSKESEQDEKAMETAFDEKEAAVVNEIEIVENKCVEATAPLRKTKKNGEVATLGSANHFSGDGSQSFTEEELSYLLFIVLDGIAKDLADQEKNTTESSTVEPICADEESPQLSYTVSEERLKKLESGIQLLMQQRSRPYNAIQLYSTVGTLGWNAPSGAEIETASILDTIDRQQKLQLNQVQGFHKQTEMLLQLVRDTLVEQRATWSAQRLMAQRETDIQRREVGLQAAALRRQQLDSMRHSLEEDARDAVNHAVVRLSDEMLSEERRLRESSTGRGESPYLESCEDQKVQHKAPEVRSGRTDSMPHFKSNWGRMLHSGADWLHASVERQKYDGSIPSTASQIPREGPHIVLKRAPGKDVAHLLSHDEVRWHVLFEKIDKNHSGGISRDSFVEAIRSSSEMTRELYDLLHLPDNMRLQYGKHDSFLKTFEATDWNENDSIGVDEFILYLKKIATGAKVIKESRALSRSSSSVYSQAAIFSNELKLQEQTSPAKALSAGTEDPPTENETIAEALDIEQHLLSSSLNETKSVTAKKSTKTERRRVVSDAAAVASYESELVPEISTVESEANIAVKTPELENSSLEFSISKPDKIPSVIEISASPSPLPPPSSSSSKETESVTTENSKEAEKEAIASDAARVASYESEPVPETSSMEFGISNIATASTDEEAAAAAKISIGESDGEIVQPPISSIKQGSGRLVTFLPRKDDKDGSGIELGPSKIDLNLSHLHSIPLLSPSQRHRVERNSRRAAVARESAVAELPVAYYNIPSNEGDKCFFVDGVPRRDTESDKFISVQGSDPVHRNSVQEYAVEFELKLENSFNLTDNMASAASTPFHKTKNERSIANLRRQLHHTLGVSEGKQSSKGGRRLSVQRSLFERESCYSCVVVRLDGFVTSKAAFAAAEKIGLHSSRLASRRIWGHSRVVWMRVIAIPGIETRDNNGNVAIDKTHSLPATSFAALLAVGSAFRGMQESDETSNSEHPNKLYNPNCVCMQGSWEWHARPIRSPIAQKAMLVTELSPLSRAARISGRDTKPSLPKVNEIEDIINDGDKNKTEKQMHRGKVENKQRNIGVEECDRKLVGENDWEKHDVNSHSDKTESRHSDFLNIKKLSPKKLYVGDTVGRSTVISSKDGEMEDGTFVDLKYLSKEQVVYPYIVALAGVPPNNVKGSIENIDHNDDGVAGTRTDNIDSISHASMPKDEGIELPNKLKGSVTALSENDAATEAANSCSEAKSDYEGSSDMFLERGQTEKNVFLGESEIKALRASIETLNLDAQANGQAAAVLRTVGTLCDIFNCEKAKWDVENAAKEAQEDLSTSVLEIKKQLQEQQSIMEKERADMVARMAATEEEAEARVHEIQMRLVQVMSDSQRIMQREMLLSRQLANKQRQYRDFDVRPVDNAVISEDIQGNFTGNHHRWIQTGAEGLKYHASGDLHAQIEDDGIYHKSMAAAEVRVQYADEYLIEEKFRKRMGLNSVDYVEDRPPSDRNFNDSSNKIQREEVQESEEEELKEDNQENNPETDDIESDEELLEEIEQANGRTAPHKNINEYSSSSQPPLDSEFVRSHDDSYRRKIRGGKKSLNPGAMNGSSGAGLCRKAAETGDVALLKEVPSIIQQGHAGLVTLRSSYVNSDHLPDFIATDPPVVPRVRIHGHDRAQKYRGPYHDQSISEALNIKKGAAVDSGRFGKLEEGEVCPSMFSASFHGGAGAARKIVAEARQRRQRKRNGSSTAADKAFDGSLDACVRPLNVEKGVNISIYEGEIPLHLTRSVDTILPPSHKDSAFADTTFQVMMDRSCLLPGRTFQ